ncbi:MAG TPA: type II toxin-antitoxin system RelE/ParE family toxin [Acidimicrobiales bacterium]|nr:type II toxin-antitoxin system RelE/ParE family toxin [Acidimicrobiales bacterium]
MTSAGGGYEVRFSARARRAVGRLPEAAAAAAIEFCFGPLSTNPERVGKQLTRDLESYHSARRGQYRVVYRIDAAAGVVFVVRIDHRRDVYRPS